MSTALVLSCGGGGGGGGSDATADASSGALTFTAASAPEWGFAAQSVSDGGPGGPVTSAGSAGVHEQIRSGAMTLRIASPTCGSVRAS